ncbi:MAG: alpha/beta hydrolase [Ferruginibacter sp.]
MKSENALYKLLFFCLLFSIAEKSTAQDAWGASHVIIPAAGLEGKKFKVEADVKADVIDDSASARIWARVDKQKGQGFFENMWKKPIRNSEWKKYTIEGKIDSGAQRLVVGTLLQFNGSFYFDNFKVSVEKQKNKWDIVYQADFENGDPAFTQGIAAADPKMGANTLFKTSVATDAAAKSKVLKIEGTDVPNFGNSKKAGHYADVNGIKMYYEIYGEGPPLVILHGNGGSSASAGSHIPDLMKKYKVIAVDSRSQGKSTDTDKPLTYDQMASDVNELLNQLHIDSAFIWGQSDGAILCLLLAKDYPKKVKRVVAYAPNVQPDSSAIEPWAVTWVNKTIAKSTDKHEVKLFEMMRDYPNVPLDDLRKIQAPCLIMGGDRDVIRLEHLVAMFKHIPNSQLCILPGATHGGAWEQKERFLSIMNDFFLKPFRMPDTKDWME